MSIRGSVGRASLLIRKSKMLLLVLAWTSHLQWHSWEINTVIAAENGSKWNDGCTTSQRRTQNLLKANEDPPSPQALQVFQHLSPLYWPMMLVWFLTGLRWKKTIFEKIMITGWCCSGGGHLARVTEFRLDTKRRHSECCTRSVNWKTWFRIYDWIGKCTFTNIRKTMMA